MSRVIDAIGVDMHVHCRETGQEDEAEFEALAENFLSATRAAIRGGCGVIVDMSNNTPKTDSMEALDAKQARAADTACADIGFHYGTNLDNDNRETFLEAAKRCFGLKGYAGETTGTDTSSSPEKFRDRAVAWKEADPDGLFILHVEGKEQVAETIEMGLSIGIRTHIPHTSIEEELSTVIRYRKENPKLAHLITCETAIHHLYLAKDDIDGYGSFRRMKPRLGSRDDVIYMRRNVDEIDAFATDHAPHPKAKKIEANELNPEGIEGKDHKNCYGVTGLEQEVLLLLEGIRDGWLTEDQLIQKIYTRPLEILRIPQRRYRNSRITVVEEEHFVVGAELETKCGITPYEGMKLHYKIGSVAIGKRNLLLDGKIMTGPGSGSVLQPIK